jgi:hypothetical protein
MAASIQHHAAGLTWFEASAMARTAHAVRSGDRYWLIDPFEDQAALEAAAALGNPAGVIQLLDRHNRDCAAIASRLEVPHMRIPSHADDTPFEVVPVIARGAWKEVALWWPEQQALIVAEAVGTAPAFALGRRVGVHPMLRATPPRRQLSGHRPVMLLVGHGKTLESGAAAALEDALAHARSDIPRFVMKLPGLIRGAR